MLAFSAALVVLVPLGLLTYLSLGLLRMGMRSTDLTDAARQRLAGCGIMLLYLTTLVLFATAIAGGFWMMRVAGYRF